MRKSHTEGTPEGRSGFLDGVGWGNLGVAILYIGTELLINNFLPANYDASGFLRSHLSVAAGLNLLATAAILVPPINLGRRLAKIEALKNHKTISSLIGIATGAMSGYIGSAFGAAAIGVALNFPR